MVEQITLERGFKAALAVTGALCINYFSGPYAAVFAREGFTRGYDYLYGVPSIISLEYLTVFSPMREHVGHAAYEYGATALALFAAPILYGSLDVAKWCFGYSSKPKEKDQTEQIQELNDQIKRLGEILQESQPEMAAALEGKEMRFTESQPSKVSMPEEQHKKEALNDEVSEPHASSEHASKGLLPL